MSRLVDLHESRLTTEPRRRGLGWGKMLGLVVIGVGAGAAVPYLQDAFEDVEVLPVREVRVVGTHGALDEQRRAEIQAYASVPAGAPLLSVDLGQVAARVRKHPYVKEATVRRLPPDALEVKVRERTPRVAVVLDEVYLADEEGALFKRALPGDGLDLPVVTGLAGVEEDAARRARLARALEVLALHRGAGAPGGMVHEVAVDEGGAITLHLDEQLRVRLGDHALKERLARLADVLGRLEASGRAAASVFLDDDRRPERVAVRLRPSAEMKGDGSKQSPRERQGREG